MKSELNLCYLLSFLWLIFHVILISKKYYGDFVLKSLVQINYFENLFFLW